jgi:hypothetical protein
VVAAKQERREQEEIEVIRDNRPELVESATVSE